MVRGDLENDKWHVNEKLGWNRREWESLSEFLLKEKLDLPWKYSLDETSALSYT